MQVLERGVTQRRIDDKPLGFGRLTLRRSAVRSDGEEDLFLHVLGNAVGPR
jgi:hypothetical protein